MRSASVRLAPGDLLLFAGRFEGLGRLGEPEAGEDQADDDAKRGGDLEGGEMPLGWPGQRGTARN
ncbi:hypothetical protein ACFXJ8_07225 [Nonomuraea sp. NPDC059194]|uniref:hypothetical protein n=1 Tax=Nonomuraea sp. NPDC059194 TaxID=3346764 RepID=UPI0036A5C252